MATNPQQKQEGTGFTNLQQLMAANQGNRLGQAVGSGIQQTGQKVQQGLQSGQQDFQNQSQANQLGTQAQKENVENVLKDPSQVNDQNAADFAKYRSGQYSGPQDISNINSLQNQAQQAQQMGQQLGSEGGRQSLLQRYAAGPGQYGAGAQRLDTLLLGTQGGQPLQQARRSVSGLTNQVNSAQQAAQQQAQQYAQQAKGFGQQVTGQVGSAEQGIYNPAQQKAQQANITEQQNLTAEQKAAGLAQNNQLSADALAALGLKAGDRTYGANLGSFLGYTPQNTQATALNQMAQPEFNKYTGLQKLMGETPASAQQNPYQAGKATFDQTGAQAAISAQKAKLDPFNEQVRQAQDISNLQKIVQDPSTAANITHYQDIVNYNGFLPPGQKEEAQQKLAQLQNQVNNAQEQLKTNYSGALGGNASQQMQWANSNLQSRLQQQAQEDALLNGTVQQVDENGNPIPTT